MKVHIWSSERTFLGKNIFDFLLNWHHGVYINNIDRFLTVGKVTSSARKPGFMKTYSLRSVACHNMSPEIFLVVTLREFQSAKKSPNFNAHQDGFLFWISKYVKTICHRLLNFPHHYSLVLAVIPKRYSLLFVNVFSLNSMSLDFGIMR